MGTDEIINRLISLEGRVYSNQHEMKNRDDYHEAEIQRLNKALEDTIPTIVHMLLDRLKQQDIQEIDEQEFTMQVNELLFGVYLPF